MAFKKLDQPTGALWNEEDLNDPRNLAYDEMFIAFGAGIPEEGNVRARGPFVFNQGRTSACTSHSTVGAYHQTVGHVLSPRYSQAVIKNDPKYPSSQLPYGAYMLDSVKLLCKEGIADLLLVPNYDNTSDEEYNSLEITDEMRKNAEDYKGGSYVYPTRTKGSTAIFDATVRYMYEQKRPVKIGVMWKQRWDGYSKTRKTGIFPARFVEGPGTGHDVLALAWKTIDGEPYIGCLNSFGEDWGDNGMVWFPRNYTKFYSPIAFVPKVSPAGKVIEKDVEVEIKDRNPWKERANAQELEAIVFKKFPLEDVSIGRRAANSVAREKFSREKLMLIKSVSYLGWKFTDVVNYLYAHSRGKTKTKAYGLNFKAYRKDFFKKK